ncbi:MAG: HPr family phosphocarrier protein [Planctomycetota bacterium]
MSLQQTVQVINPQGLHARPADLLVRCAASFQSNILLQKGSEQVDCRSILSLLTLGATTGTELTLVADGDDAAEAIAAISDLFQQGFHEIDDATPTSAASSNQPST